MPSFFRIASVSLAAIGLMSCSGVRTVNYGQPYQPLAARSFLHWAGSAGPVPIEVRNNPFPESNEVVASVIADAASDRVAGLTTRFTADAGEAPHPDWRVVYAFNVAPSTAAARICDPSQPTQPGGSRDTLTVLVVFCNETKPIISAGVWSPPIAGPATPEFRSLAQHGMTDLFPPEFMGIDRDQPDWPEP